jgi:hypothetical protein
MHTASEGFATPPASASVRCRPSSRNQYDLVFPETARCLALAGADVIFFPTMGGAAVGDDDIGLQALRVTGAEWNGTDPTRTVARIRW